MRIAVAQMDASENQFARATHLLDHAARAGSDFCLFPELMNCPWLPAEEETALRGAAESEGGPSLTRLSALARDRHVNVIAPLYERDGDRCFGTAYVIARDGRVVGRYRKNHIPDAAGWREKFYYGPGDDGFPVFEHEGLRFGIQICWDNMFPEGTRALALDGAQLVFAPRATGRASLDRWLAVLKANAAVNHVFVATANRVGRDRGVSFGGHSLIVDPYGKVVAQVDPPAESGICLADVDPSDTERAARDEPYFAHRRPEIYGRLVATV